MIDYYTVYGIAPFNWIREGELLASIYPPDLDYLRFLYREGIRSAINLDPRPWPTHWAEETSLDYLHLPTVDMSVPTAEQIEEGLDFMRENLKKGGVMVHCIAGLGRSGTLIALFLVREGMDPRDSIELVRSRREGSIQSSSQERTILDFNR